jgi:hypothetical protein
VRQPMPLGSAISTAFQPFLVTSDLAPAIRDLPPLIEAATLRSVRECGRSQVSRRGAVI